jgi:hypothetical protein
MDQKKNLNPNEGNRCLGHFVVAACGGHQNAHPSRISSEGGGSGVMGGRNGGKTPPTRVLSEGGV